MSSYLSCGHSVQADGTERKSHGDGHYNCVMVEIYSKKRGPFWVFIYFIFPAPLNCFSGQSAEARPGQGIGRELISPYCAGCCTCYYYYDGYYWSRQPGARGLTRCSASAPSPSACLAPSFESIDDCTNGCMKVVNLLHKKVNDE